MNLASTTNGLKEVKDVVPGDQVRCGNEWVTVTNPPEYGNCVRIHTNINVTFTVQQTDRRIHKSYYTKFMSTVKYSGTDNYGYLAMGRYQTRKSRGNNTTSIMQTTRPEETRALYKSVCCLDHLVYQPTRTGNKTIIPQPHSDVSKITDASELSENSIRWFLQGYFSGNLVMAKVRHAFLGVRNVTPIAALIMRLANIELYPVTGERTQYWKGLNNATHWMNDSDSWKCLQLMYESPLVDKKFFDDKFGRTLVEDVYRMRNSIRGDGSCQITQTERVQDWYLPGLYPNINGLSSII